MNRGSGNPARTIRLQRLKRRPPGFLTAAEKRRLLKSLKGHAGPAALRDRVMIEVLLGTGIRLYDSEMRDSVRYVQVEVLEESGGGEIPY